MVKTGDVVIKLAGRDAGRIAVVVEDLGNGYYTIDGDARKRKVNFKHIEFLGKEIKVGKGATSEEIRKVLGEMGFKVHKHGAHKAKKETKEENKETKNLKRRQRNE